MILKTDREVLIFNQMTDDSVIKLKHSWQIWTLLKTRRLIDTNLVLGFDCQSLMKRFLVLSRSKCQFEFVLRMEMPILYRNTVILF